MMSKEKREKRIRMEKEGRSKGEGAGGRLLYSKKKGTERTMGKRDESEGQKATERIWRILNCRDTVGDCIKAPEIVNN